MTRFWLAFLAVLWGSAGWAQEDQKADRPQLVQDVTNEEVRTFLDPTAMINHFEFAFATNFLGGGATLYENRFEAFWALNGRSAIWAEAPVRTLNLPDVEQHTGWGDTVLGVGLITHENLERRLTASILTFEVLAPTGDSRKGTGFDTWVLAPGAAAAFNPTDVFPVYVEGRYLHSLGGSGGDLRVRSLELTIQTIHIFPKGIYVSAVPRLTLNFEQSFNFFSMGAGIGRALNSRLGISGGYVHHVAGEKTFSRGFAVNLQLLSGARKDR